jgi:type IV pilus assembly protein PilV
MLCHRTRTRCRGFTLAEVLVALLVVALGVAGAAALQTRALRTARAAAHLSAGTRLAASLAERMRANPVAMALEDADNPYLSFDYDAASGPPSTVASCYAGADCDSVQLAAFDRFETAQEVAAIVPGGRIHVCRDASPPDASTGLPGWHCDGRDGAPLAIKLGWRETDAPDAPAVPRVLLFVGAGASAALPAGAP